MFFFRTVRFRLSNGCLETLGLGKAFGSSSCIHLHYSPSLPKSLLRQITKCSVSFCRDKHGRDLGKSTLSFATENVCAQGPQGAQCQTCRFLDLPLLRSFCAFQGTCAYCVRHLFVNL